MSSDISCSGGGLVKNRRMVYLLAVNDLFGRPSTHVNEKPNISNIEAKYQQNQTKQKENYFKILIVYMQESLHKNMSTQPLSFTKSF